MVAPQDLADDAIALVRRWLDEASHIPVDSTAAQLAGVLKDPNGLDFTVGFVDGVVRPEDVRVAAGNLRKLVPLTPAFLPWYMRYAIALGGAFAPAFPGIVVPISRKVLRGMVKHLIVDATDARLGASIAAIKGGAGTGTKLNINLLGEAILGDNEAKRRLEGTRRLLARDDVDYVSIKVSSTVAPHSDWGYAEAVEHVIEKLTPLYQLANKNPKNPKFINLDMEEFKDLDLTIEVFTRILDKPEFLTLPAGIVLQAYLPDALRATMELQEWSAKRVARGGAPIKVRVVKGANLPMETVDAAVHGWPLATWGSKQDSDTSYKAVIDYALHPDRIKNMRIGVAGHNLFDIALAWLLAKARGVESGIEIEMLLGMATAQAAAVKKEVGDLLLYTPVVHPAEFDVAIAYLIRRLEEGASKENFMSAVFDLDSNEALFQREKDRFLASLADLTDQVPPSNRVQDRREPAEPGKLGHFANTPDTDPSLSGNREWGSAIIAKMEESKLGEKTAVDNLISDASALDTVIDTAVSASASWQAMSADERATILHRAGDVMEAKRAELLETMGSECGKTLDQGDPEISEAIDFAHYYAELGRKLGDISGATFVPSKLTVVVPPWNFPVAIPAGSTLSALAAGSSVVIKPATQARRSGAMMVEALWEAGVPRDVLQYIQLADRDLGTHLISHPAVDRVILTGGYETAELFRGFRKDLPLLAETSGKNAIIVTPDADLDLAAKDVVYSAFGHAGQKCSAASLVIMVGSVAKSKRFRAQLLDAARSLTVGYPWQPSTQMGPIIAPASGKLLGGLTKLAPGETWAIKPEKLDKEGKLWSPGIRYGVKRNSEFHLTEYFGPVLGIMVAETLEEAVSIVNDVDYGLTSGLHSLNRDEIGYWLDNIQAGNLYVNRGITGAIVQRQPFGGWKKSAVGAGTKAGGPNYLIGMGSWTDAPATVTAPADAAVKAAVNAATSAGASTEDAAWLETALRSDVDAWRDEFGVARDVSALGVERNVFRYLPVPVTVRFEGSRVADLVRVVAAGVRAGSRVSVSTAKAVPASLGSWMSAAGVSVRTETAAQWADSAAALAAEPARIRIIGGTVTSVADAVNGHPTVAIYGNEVVSAGRVEMLPFLHEQAVSITAHRFGTPNALTEGLI